MQLTGNPEDKMCKNGCKYAKKVQWSTHEDEKGLEEEGNYMYRCMKLDNQLVTIDTILHKVGCASFIYEQTPTAEPAKSYDPCGKECPTCPSECRVDPCHTAMEQKMGDIALVATAIESFEDQIAAINAEINETAYTEIPVSHEPGEVPLHKVIVVTPEKVVEVPAAEPVKKRRGRPPRKKDEPAATTATTVTGNTEHAKTEPDVRTFTTAVLPEKKPEMSLVTDSIVIHDIDTGQSVVKPKEPLFPVADHGRFVEPSHTEPDAGMVVTEKILVQDMDSGKSMVITKVSPEKNTVDPAPATEQKTDPKKQDG